MPVSASESDEQTARALLESGEDSENLLNRILLTSAAAVLLVDRQGQIVFANPRAEEILGIPASATQQGEVNVTSLSLMNTEGHPVGEDDLPYRHVIASGEPLLGTTYMLLREIRTPLNAVLGMSRLLLDTDVTQVQREHLLTIVDAGESLLTIINDILDLSKIEADKLNLEHLPFSLEDSLFDTLRSLAFRADEKSLELIGDIRPAIPMVVGDPARLRQILINLVGNAIKFTPSGQVVVSVAMPERCDDKTVVSFEVTDTGIGIPQERLASVFEPFEQADSGMTRKFGGTGLGLALVSRLAGLMGGASSVLRADARS